MDPQKELKEKIAVLEKQMEELRKKQQLLHDAVYKMYEDQRRRERKL